MKWRFEFYRLLAIQCMVHFNKNWSNGRNGGLVCVLLSLFLSLGTVWHPQPVSTCNCSYKYVIVKCSLLFLHRGTKVGVCLLPNTCVGFGTRVLANLETRNIGLTFSNFASPVSLDDQFHMGWVVLMLFIDTILYMTLYWLVVAAVFFFLKIYILCMNSV